MMFRSGGGPFRVKRGSGEPFTESQLHPNERTSSVRADWSVSCQERSWHLSSGDHKLSSRLEIGSVGRDRFLVPFKANARHSANAPVLGDDC
jgi:hypothetical protein